MTIRKTMSKVTTRDQALELLDSYQFFLFDCDGVIWLDNDLIPGVRDLLDHLRDTDKKFAFVTNNSSRSRENYLSKFAKLGISGVSKDMIFPTCYSAALVLKEKLKIPEKSKVWVLGDSGIQEELVECGYVPVGGSDPRLDVEWDPDHELLEVDPEVKAVVVGSTKKLNYMRLATSVQYLLHDNKAIPFIGTNIDRTYPGPSGRILPAGGSVVLTMKQTCDRDFIDVGKPSTVLLETILELTGFEREKTLMVGDTLYTDIKFGNDGQLGGEAGGSLLVLSGGTKARDLDLIDETDVSLQPSYYIESLGHLVELVRL